jgi:regulatory protein
MQEVDPRQLRLQAMNLLARREHLRRELENKLSRRFGSEFESEIHAVLDTLEEENLLSDVRFTHAYIRQRSAKGYGPERIRQELKQKGVAGNLLDDAMAAADVDWVALAREVRIKKFGNDMPCEFSEKARQLRFLNYRGFGGEFAGAALAGEALDSDLDA